MKKQCTATISGALGEIRCELEEGHDGYHQEQHAYNHQGSIVSTTWPPMPVERSESRGDSAK